MHLFHFVGLDVHRFLDEALGFPLICELDSAFLTVLLCFTCMYAMLLCEQMIPIYVQLSCMPQ